MSVLKSSNDDVISALDDFSDLWDPSTATPIEEMPRSQWGLYIYIYIYIFTNLISTSIHGIEKTTATVACQTLME